MATIIDSPGLCDSRAGVIRPPESKWNYVFLFSNLPTPRMLDKVRVAVSEGYRVLLVYCVRVKGYVKLESIDGCDIISRSVPYRGVDLRRLLSLPGMAFWLRSRVFRYAEQGCCVHTDSIDLLALAQVAAFGKFAVFHHQVRDLHELQLGQGAICALLRFVDRLLLRRVSMLVLTCEGYYEQYYSRLYRGEHVVVENWPELEVWRDFKRQRSESIVVGFVGVVRYLDCLKALIKAIEIVRERGHDVRLKIAGGGDLDQLHATIDGRNWIDVHGPFCYREQIQSLYADVDVIWSVYDARIRNVRVAMPNKFYESILSGIPIIVADETYLAQRVRTEGIGRSVPGLDAAAIAEALEHVCNRTNWYADAENALQQVDATDYFLNEHPRRIRLAVVGGDCDSEAHPPTGRRRRRSTPRRCETVER